MSSSYHRSTSPGRRAIYSNNYGRLSDVNTSAAVRDTSYLSPRSSGDRLVPVSTQTFVRDGRTSDRLGDRLYESHGRPRRSTLNESSRPAHLFVNPTATPPRSTTMASNARPASPLARTAKEAEGHQKSVKKVYAIGDTKTLLVDHIDMNAKKPVRTRHPSIDRDGHHSRRHALDSNGYVTTGGPRGGKQYHLTGPSSSRDPEPQYIQPIGMFEDTEPTWRRRRRGSVDGRERPVSMVLESSPRHSARELGPPPSRALERYNEGISRSNSGRHHQRPAGRYEESGYTSQDDYGDRVRTVRRSDTVPTAAVSDYDHRRQPLQPTTVIHDRRPDVLDPYITSSPGIRDGYASKPYEDRHAQDYRYDERREPRSYERTQPPQPHYTDASIERRGFGLRPASTERQGGRASNENFDRRAPPEERLPLATADPRDYPRSEFRVEPQDTRAFYTAEPERIDRDRARDEPREDARRREKDNYRGPRDDHEPRERDSHRSGDNGDRYREYDRDYNRDREREREKRHDSQRYDKDPYDSKLSGLLPVAMASGLGAAAIASKKKDKARDRSSSSSGDQKDHDRERDRDHHEKRKQRNLEPAKEPLASESRRPYPANDPDVISKPTERSAPAAPQPTSPVNDADEEYRRRLLQAQQMTYRARNEPTPSHSQPPQEKPRELEYSRKDRDDRYHDRDSENGLALASRDTRRSTTDVGDRGGYANAGTDRLVSSGSSEGMNDIGEKKQNRVRIVEPPSESNENKPKGILKKPKDQFPEHPDPIREGVAPMKDKKQSKEIPPDARWTKVSREYINPEALEMLGERYEEREGCIIILRVLERDEINKIATKTREIRDDRWRRRQRSDQREARRQARRDADEYEESSSSDEFSEDRRAPRLLEAPSTQAGAPPTFSAPPTVPAMAAPPPPQLQPVMSGSMPGSYPPPPAQGQGMHMPAEDYSRDRERDRDRRDRDRDRDRERDRERERERDRERDRDRGRD